MAKEPTKAELQSTIKKLQANERKLLKRIEKLERIAAERSPLSVTPRTFPWDGETS